MAGRLLLVLLLASAVVGVSILLASTPHGLGVSDDSVIYIGAARNLVDGRGLSRLEGDGSAEPITHYPPGYPLALAGWLAAGGSLAAGARLITIVSFLISILFVGLLTWELTQSTVLSLLPSLLLALSPIALDVHVWAMSEPLFVAFTLMALWALARYLAGGRALYLYGSALILGFGWLSRYVGYTLLATSILSLAMQAKAWRDRIDDIARFVPIAATPVVAWLVRNIRLTGSATNRQLAWHPVGWGKLKSGLLSVGEWVYGGRPPSAWMALPALLALLLIFGIFLRSRLPQKRDEPEERGRKLTGLALPLFTEIYTLSLLLSISLFDYSTPIDRRLLFPLYPIVLVVGACTLRTFWPRLRRFPWLRTLTVVLLVAGLARYTWETVETADRLRADAGGFASKDWRQSEVVDFLRDLPPETAIYTNEPVAVYYLVNRGSYMVPIRFDSVVGKSRGDYEASLREMSAELQSGQAVLVLLDSIRFQTDLAPEQRMTAGLDVVAEDQRMRLFADLQ